MDLKCGFTKWLAIFSLLILASCGGGGSSPSSPGDVINGGGDPVSGGGGGGGGSLISEGTTSVPKDLGIAPVTYANGTVAKSGHSYYQFTTAKAGSYIIKLTNTTAKMGWALYSQKSSLGNFFASSIASADDIFTTIGDLIATAHNLDADTTYYLEVDDWDSVGGTYTISIINGSSEGSKNTPIALVMDGSSHAGGVDTYGYSYYSFTTTGGSYVITLGTPSVATDILSWRIYSDSAFTSPIAGETCNDNYSSGTPGAITCAASNLTAGTYYLQVYNYGSQDTSYSISVTPDNVDGYIKTPMQLGLEATYTRSIPDNGSDYYYFVVPLGGSGSYKINLTSMTADMGWQLYSDSGYSTAVLKCDAGTSAGTESCITSNLDHGTYYVKVFANNTPPGTYPYTIQLTGLGCSEGSVNEPVSLSTGVSHAGKAAPGGADYVHYGYSYYTFTPAQNTAYLISLTSVSTGARGLSWKLYSSSDFSTGNIAQCGDVTYTADVICRTGTYYLAPSVKLTANSQYYLAVGNFATSANTYTVTITPFDLSLGCNGGGTCMNFEGATIPASITNNPSGPASVGSMAPWALATETPGIGTGTQGFQSTVPKNGSYNVYVSCFEFTATDLKWIGYSLQMTANSAGNSGVLDIYFDSGVAEQIWGPGSWDRFVFMAPSGGTHTYEWCYTSAPSTDAVWLDDIELHY